MKVLGTTLDLVNKKVVNLADPAAAGDAVNLQTLQAFVRGLSWKQSVRASSTANVTVTAPGATLDGVTLAVNDRVLLKNQTAAAENGIYVWTGSATTLTRAADADTAAELVGASVLVTEGTVGADKQWNQTVDTITLGTTALAWSQFGGGGAAYTAGNGLALATNTFSVVPGVGILADGTSTRVDTAVVVRKFAASVGNGALTTIVTAHGLGTADVTVAVRDAATGELVYPDITVDATNVTLVFSTAPATNAYRLVAHA